jgi:hypothetical protein
MPQVGDAEGDAAALMRFTLTRFTLIRFMLRISGKGGIIEV